MTKADIGWLAFGLWAFLVVCLLAVAGIAALAYLFDDHRTGSWF